MKRLTVWFLAIAMLAVTGCGGVANEQTAAGGEKSIKVGFIAPLQGDAKTYGESAKKGFELALDQAGGKAGDYRIDVVWGDDRNDPTEGVNLATKMINQDGVKAIVGAVTSKVTIPVSELANASRVTMITGTATAEKVTVDDKGTRKPFVFRAPFIDPFQGQVAAKFAIDTLKVKTAVVLYDKSNDYTVGLAEVFKKSFEEKGGKVVGYEAYAKEDSDFSAVMTNAAAKHPDMLYLPDYYNKVSLIAKTAKAKGLNVPMLGADGWDSADLDFATMEGGYFTNHYSADDPRPEVQKFVADFQQKYGQKPDAFASLSYDATNLLLEGIRKAGSSDSDRIREAMQNLKDVPCVGGKISFDAKGNPIKSAVILQVQKDKSYKFVTTVQP